MDRVDLQPITPTTFSKDRPFDFGIWLNSVRRAFFTLSGLTPSALRAGSRTVPALRGPSTRGIAGEFMRYLNESGLSIDDVTLPETKLIDMVT
ncbi:MAG: hypothetical protein IPG80_18485 [Anaerolineales bacterium]|uniref:hypothetical protein n=1 Tax=Candidatus Villigracilis vicinus TaxID=3140679 RepID=UPI0031371023|nr:hypothetical protein [Anaerolineales bacterium]